MPKPPRFVAPGLPQRVIARANNGDPIFIAEEDYSTYLNWLQSAVLKHGRAIHA